MWVALGLNGCAPPGSWTETPPVAKIGLVAPFEGLYRQTGYAALGGLRAAIADAPARSPALLPLALDDGGAPDLAARATAKVLVDPTAQALIGPLRPDTAAAAAPLLAVSPRLWLLPYRLPYPPQPDEEDPSWAVALVQGVAGFAQARGARGLVLAGVLPGWPEWSRIGPILQTPIPVRVDESPLGVAAGEGVLWLGTAENGADYLAELWQEGPETAVWLAPWAADPVLVGRFEATGAAWGPIFRAAWLGPDFPGWQADHPEQSHWVYLSDRAGRAAAAAIQGRDGPDFRDWALQEHPFVPSR